jgi:hypothetical protein
MIIGNNALNIAVKKHFFGFRIGCFLLQLRGPALYPLFSERSGSRKPKLKAFGWRLHAGIN